MGRKIPQKNPKYLDAFALGIRPHTPSDFICVYYIIAVLGKIKFVLFNLKKVLLFAIVLICCVSLFFILLFSCELNCSEDKYINGVYVYKFLSENSCYEHRVNYCKMLKKATMNDAESIKKITFLHFDNAYAYAHGSTLIGLIKLIGEDEFIRSLGIINEKQKSKILTYLAAGMEYGDYPEYKNYIYMHGHNKTIEKVFPKIYEFTKQINIEK